MTTRPGKTRLFDNHKKRKEIGKAKQRETSTCRPITDGLTIIIPAINELDNLRRLTTDIQQQQGIVPKILIADGGSKDGTQVFAREERILLLACPPGRGKQMNLAARQISSGLLLFLHADTRLPNPDTLRRALEHYSLHQPHYSGILAGHFPIRFERKDAHRHKLFWRYAEEKTQFNRPDTINGDQGLLISKAHFTDLGGFDEALHFLEDQKIAEMIFKRGQWIVLPDYILTSARRFETEGKHRLYILMAIIMGLFKTGFSDFFELAPALYRQQKFARKLSLTPFFKLIWQIKAQKLGLKKSVRAWYRVGRYVRSHSWQLFYFIDQLCRPIYRRKIYPFLWFHDHCFEKLIRNPIANTLTMLLAFAWFMGVIQPAYWLIERRSAYDYK